MGSPALYSNAEATYAPNADITPCEKLVVNQSDRHRYKHGNAHGYSGIQNCVKEITHKFLTPTNYVSGPDVADACGNHANDTALFDLALLNTKLKREDLVDLTDVAVVL